MNLKTHSEKHAEWMQDPEYRAAYDDEMRRERLRNMLAEWRSHENLTSREVARRMGVTPSTVSKMENNVTSARLDTLYRYAQACHITNPVIVL